MTGFIANPVMSELVRYHVVERVAVVSVDNPPVNTLVADCVLSDESRALCHLFFAAASTSPHDHH